MKKTQKRSLIALVLLIAAVFLCMFYADRIQTGFGTVEVTEGVIETEPDIGGIAYKLYTPKTATAADPAPGVLLLHGYQNDHETCAAYAIELARRGAVVMAIDEYGHGKTEPGMIERGYVNHRVKVNFGEEDESTFVSVGGATRFRLMMNFSNLSFFDETYSKDTDGNSVKDSSMGGIAAYAVLAEMPEVDASRMAVSGHSMGTWASWTVAAAYAGTEMQPKATVLQCGELFRDTVYDSEKITFDNVLLLQAKYEEFSYFRDYQLNVTEDLLKSDLRTEFLGCTAGEAAWNTTYGSFDDGSARRIELLQTNHRLTTHHGGGLAAAISWLDSAVDLPTGLHPDDQIAMGKEVLVLCAMLCAVAATLPLMDLLLGLPFFAAIIQPLPSKNSIKKKGAWWKGAVITILIAAVTYPFMTQLGHGLLPLPEGVFRMTVGNGFVSWYGILILIMLGTNLISDRKSKKKGKVPSRHAMGLGTEEKPTRIGWGIFGRSVLLVFFMILLVYVLVLWCELLFKLDFRFIWPFFKTFDLTRFGQFFVYIPFFALFYILNNSKIFAGLRTEATYQPGAKGFLACWLRYLLVMLGGTLIVILLEYVPFFMGIGPGADVLFGSTFGGPFMSLLILFAPQVLGFSLICTYCYRRTGTVYPGALTVATLACWIVTGGSAML